MPGRHVFEVRNGAPPATGRISGRVLDAAGAALVDAQVQVCDAGGACSTTRSVAGGDYSVAGLASGEYTVTAFPPAASTLASATLGPLTLQRRHAHGSGRAPDQPRRPAGGHDRRPSEAQRAGRPDRLWGEPVNVVAHGCAGATAAYTVTVGTAVVASGALTEAPAGTYTATVPPLAPRTGVARFALALDCPGAAPDETIGFDVYIDPSGMVRALDGTPIVGATVTLYRSDTPSGPFVQVPDGSAIMAPNNRRNPDMTVAGGRFGWDVIAGYYKVRAQATGASPPTTRAGSTPRRRS